MMDKFGNSSTKERIDLMQRFIGLFGINSIDCLLADREFIGDQWMGFLNINRIRYHIRIRENFWVTIPRNGHCVQASWLFHRLKINQFEFFQELSVSTGNFVIYQHPKLKTNKGLQSCRLSFHSTSQRRLNHYTKNGGRLKLHSGRSNQVDLTLKIRT